MTHRAIHTQAAHLARRLMRQLAHQNRRDIKNMSVTAITAVQIAERKRMIAAGIHILRATHRGIHIRQVTLAAK